MNFVEISCDINTTNAQVPLGLEIWIDGQCVFDQSSVTSAIAWRHSVSDHDGEHIIQWILKNKTQDHTVIDEQGNILQDARLIISNLSFDGIFELGHVFVTNSVYTHDYNGTTEIADHKFYGEMGCNGSVSLKFTTPIYLWLLENL